MYGILTGLCFLLLLIIFTAIVIYAVLSKSKINSSKHIINHFVPHDDACESITKMINFHKKGDK